MARGERTNLNQIFHFGPLVGKMAKAHLSFSILVCLGIMCLVLPAFLVLVLYWPFGRLLVDKNCRAREAISGSFHLTRKHFLTSLGLVLLTIGVMALGQMLILGILFAFPFHGVLFTVAYLHFSGEFVTGERQRITP